MQVISYIVPEKGTNGQGYMAGCRVQMLINLDQVLMVKHTEGNAWIEVHYINGESITIPITFDQWVDQTNKEPR